MKVLGKTALTRTLVISFAGLGALFLVHSLLNSSDGLPDPAVVVGDSPEPATGSSVDSNTEAPLDDILQELLETYLAAQTVPISLLEQWPKTLAKSYQQVQELRRETTADSLAHLWDVEMFYSPGLIYTPDSLTHSFPIDGFVGKEKIPRLLSNRRVLKLLFELSDMPHAEADRLVASQIKEAMTRYDDAFNKEIVEHLRLWEVDARFETGFSFLISNRDDGTPTFQGLRHSLLALVYIAGVLKLDNQARMAVGSVLDMALGQRDFFYGQSGKSLNPGLAANALNTASLYERQVLAVGLVGTGNLSLDLIDLARNQLPQVNQTAAGESEKTTLTVPRFDALTTPFELPSVAAKRGSPLYIAPDLSGGKMEVPFCPYVDDDMFNLVVEQWRQH